MNHVIKKIDQLATNIENNQFDQIISEYKNDD